MPQAELPRIDIPQVELPPLKSVSRANARQDPDTTSKLPKLGLSDCLSIALERQPKLAALRASLASAQTSQQALVDARMIAILSPDYKYRQEQAANGVAAACAELEQATHEVTQAVVWTYYSVVYARQQTKVAIDTVDFVDYYRPQVEKIVNDKKGGNREINQLTLNRLIIRLTEGKRLSLRAEAGVEKAYAALREAMGVEPTYLFNVADEVMPDFGSFEIQKETVIAHARTRRGEVIMASRAADVTQLEAYIQWSNRFRLRTQTFAASADIHTRPIPSGRWEGEYRPDAIGPEMPANVFGHRKNRTQKINDLVARSQAVLDKTVGLVTLEAENAFVDYQFAGKAMIQSREQSDTAKKNLDTLKEVAGDKVNSAATLQQLLEAAGEAGQARAAYNEAFYQRISALANIERITAGGIKINYPGR